MSIGDTGCISILERSMDIIDDPTILTEAHHDSITQLCILTLTWEYHPFSRDCDLVDESLIPKCIDDTIERCEIHARLSFFSDEIFPQVRESDTRIFSEDFDKSFARFGDTSF
jgi:hypothetical protein